MKEMKRSPQSKTATKSKPEKQFQSLKKMTGRELKGNLIQLWLDNCTTGYFVTLSFNRKFFFERGFGEIDKFFRRILQRVHGQRWQKRIRRDQDFVVYGFCEYEGENVHFHLGVWGEKQELNFLRKYCNEEWRKLQPQGDCSTEKIKDVFLAADYSYKSNSDRDSQASLYVFVFPDRKVLDAAQNKPKPDKRKNRATIWKNKINKWLKLRGKVSLTKKNRGKIARYGEELNKYE